MFYNELSGRSNFMDDLLLTLKECFINYKTYNALIDSLKKT